MTDDKKMDAKELLEDVKSSLWSCQAMEKTIKELDGLIGASAIRYDSERITSSPKKDGLEKMAIEHIGRVEAVKKELLQMTVHYAEVKKLALYFISQLESDDQKEVLEMRYLNGMRWWDILEARHCDNLASQMQLRDRAIDKLQEVMNKISEEKIQ